MTGKKYQVIARKYRPQRFSEVVGQEAVLQTLRNALKRDAIAHAYLFCGSRGVGKTTLARLFAKALNCENPEAGEPCCACPSCLEIAAGQSLDVIEIDGASNRGIDDIRQINETVGFAPSHGKYKIYLIDEVHMLTKEAFNALLKTLEEPPEQVKFFFATTEPHKVLPTIISRCQRFDLGRLSHEAIYAKLESIAADLQRPVEPEAIHLLSQFADGSLRDAESLLDQLLCFADGTVSALEVQKALGLSPNDLFFSFDEAFAGSRLSYAFELAAQLFDSGRDLAHFLDQMIEHARRLVVCKTLGEAALRLPASLAAKYSASARNYTQFQTLALLDLLVQAETHFSKSSSPRIALELTLLQGLRLKNKIPIEALVRRLGEIEEKLSATPAAPDPAPTPQQAQNSPPEPVAAPLPQPELKEAPFNPFKEPKPAEETISAAPIQQPLPPEPKEAAPPPKPQLAVKPQEAVKSPAAAKHPSHYETLMRFAAVELEGTIKKT